MNIDVQVKNYETDEIVDVTLSNVPEVEDYPYATLFQVAHPAFSFNMCVLVLTDKPLYVFPATITGESSDAIDFIDLIGNGASYSTDPFSHTGEWAMGEVMNNAQFGVYLGENDGGINEIIWSNYDIKIITSKNDDGTYVAGNEIYGEDNSAVPDVDITYSGADLPSIPGSIIQDYPYAVVQHIKTWPEGTPPAEFILLVSQGRFYHAVLDSEAVLGSNIELLATASDQYATYYLSDNEWKLLTEEADASMYMKLAPTVYENLTLFGYLSKYPLAEYLLDIAWVNHDVDGIVIDGFIQLAVDMEVSDDGNGNVGLVPSNVILDDSGYATSFEIQGPVFSPDDSITYAPIYQMPTAWFIGLADLARKISNQEKLLTLEEIDDIFSSVT